MGSMRRRLSERNSQGVTGVSTRRRKTVLLMLVVGALLAIAGGAAPAGASGFFSGWPFTVTDNGANDINSAQNDLTQFGRDESDPSVDRIFWSWDSTSAWTGTGQTGNACALFDTNGNGKINFAVCGVVQNANASASVVVQAPGSPFAYSCNDGMTSRCAGSTGPLPHTAGDIQGGAINPLTGVLSPSPPANLITATDPFPNLNPDQNWPNDTTLEVVIRKGYLPANAVLKSVCSFPSTGGGANNSPSDCIAAS